MAAAKLRVDSLQDRSVHLPVRAAVLVECGHGKFRCVACTTMFTIPEN
jgi:hypothetical protein